MLFEILGVNRGVYEGHSYVNYHVKQVKSVDIEGFVGCRVYVLKGNRTLRQYEVGEVVDLEYLKDDKGRFRIVGEMTAASAGK